MNLVIATPMNSTTDRSVPAPLAIPGWIRTGMRATSAIAPGLAARTAKRMFFTPTRSRARGSESQVLAPAHTFSIRVRRKRVAGYTWGDGPTVLLVHGWGGHAGHLSGFVDPLIRSGFRAVAIDLPGHGRSEGRFSSLVHGADAIEELDGVFGSFAGAIAHSFGAAMLTYAISRGVPVDRAVYVAPAATFEPYWERFREAAGLTPQVMDRFILYAEKWLDVRFAGVAAADLAPTMDIPLLILHSADDRQIAIEEGALLAERWPGAELHKVDGLGHRRVLGDPESIGEAVQFLCEPAPRRG